MTLDGFVRASVCTLVGVSLGCHGSSLSETYTDELPEEDESAAPDGFDPNGTDEPEDEGSSDDEPESEPSRFRRFIYAVDAGIVDGAVVDVLSDGAAYPNSVVFGLVDDQWDNFEDFGHACYVWLDFTAEQCTPYESLSDVDEAWALWVLDGDVPVSTYGACDELNPLARESTIFDLLVSGKIVFGYGGITSDISDAISGSYTSEQAEKIATAWIGVSAFSNDEYIEFYDFNSVAAWPIEAEDDSFHLVPASSFEDLVDIAHEPSIQNGFYSTMHVHKQLVFD